MKQNQPNIINSTTTPIQTNIPNNIILADYKSQLSHYLQKNKMDTPKLKYEYHFFTSFFNYLVI